MLGASSWRPQPRIIGGAEVAPPLRYSYMAAVYTNGGFSCGGAFVSVDHVVTAAHCISPSLSASAYTVGVFRHDISKPVSSDYACSTTLDVQWAVRHPEWDDVLYTADVAVLKLTSSSYPCADTLVPVTLDDGAAGMFWGSSAVVLGWGNTRYDYSAPGYAGSNPSPTLRQVQLPILTNSECSARLRSGDRDWYKPYAMLCAGGYAAGGKDACSGDSGGPLVLSDPAATPSLLIGTSSWGPGCGLPDTPGAYARVSTYRTWIAVTASLPLPPPSRPSPSPPPPPLPPPPSPPPPSPASPLPWQPPHPPAPPAHPPQSPSPLLPASVGDSPPSAPAPASSRSLPPLPPTQLSAAPAAPPSRASSSSSSLVLGLPNTPYAIVAVSIAAVCCLLFLPLAIGSFKIWRSKRRVPVSPLRGRVGVRPISPIPVAVYRHGQTNSGGGANPSSPKVRQSA